MIHHNQSIAGFPEVGSEGLDPLVELSGVLGDVVGHLVLYVEGADEDEFAGLDDAGSSVLLHKGMLTFLR
jgi:hypothetical protein